MKKFSDIPKNAQRKFHSELMGDKLSRVGFTQNGDEIIAWYGGHILTVWRNGGWHHPKCHLKHGSRKECDVSSSRDLKPESKIMSHKIKRTFRGRIRRDAAPKGPASGFGKEKTVADIRARIAWEKWAEKNQRKLGHEALAVGHALARVRYEELLRGRSSRDAKIIPFPKKPSPTTRLPTQGEYERREIEHFLAQMREVERAPLRERKEAQAEFYDTMRSAPHIVAERIGWLLDGNYGYGAMIKAKQVLHSPRMNREAALVQMTAALEWSVPGRMVADAWKKLSQHEKQQLSKFVMAEIKSAEKGS